MNYDNIKDYRLQKFFKKTIAEQNYSDSFILRTFANCGNKGASEIAGVSLLSNHTHSRIYGAKMCGNSWACPVCSAIKMAKAAAKIAVAIDALKEKDYVPIMITFTVFHSKADSCQQVFDLLYGTWRTVTYQGTKSRANVGAWGRFIHELEIKHRVRCAEVTYSENGWHPHFHCLFWIHKSKLTNVLQYEESLRAQWQKAQEKVMKKIYGFVKYNAFYESKKQHGEGAAGIYISKADGLPIIQKSSDYLCGWGADKEVTGNYLKKATNPTSMTPYQILQKASEGDEKCKKLYLEFAKYIILHKVRRYDFSRQGLNQIIQDKINSEGYKEVLKKKRMQYLEDTGKWHLVAWFSSGLWSKICRNEDDLVSILLEWAKLENGYNLIIEELKKRQFLELPLNYDPVGYSDSLIKFLNAA